MAGKKSSPPEKPLKNKLIYIQALALQVFNRGKSSTNRIVQFAKEELDLHVSKRGLKTVINEVLGSSIEAAESEKGLRNPYKITTKGKALALRNRAIFAKLFGFQLEDELDLEAQEDPIENRGVHNTALVLQTINLGQKKGGEIHAFITRELKLKIDKSVVHRELRKLVRDGLIETTDSEKILTYKLTGEGEERCKQYRAIVKKLFEFKD